VIAPTVLWRLWRSDFIFWAMGANRHSQAFTQQGRRRGFTLVEIVVVLILLALAAGLVVPALIIREEADRSPLAQIISGSSELAARRGEIVHLRVAADGAWQVEGAASVEQGVLASGRLAGFDGPAFTLVISPIGTCGFDVRSSAAARVLLIDPLTCQLQADEAGTS
jgi:prepilin-type N-terminal cleavage/methylation domain-containing protein